MHGEDLIQISYHTSTCEMCAPRNGKVLSLTGQTPGYPTLAEAEGAGLFHPNCRHASSLFIPESPEDLLSDSERLVIPEEKLTKYALNMSSERGRDKAIAFEKALGYNLANYEDLIFEIRDAVPDHEPELRGRNQYGDLYQTIVKIKGPSGKKANVLIGWIYKPSENEVKMTTIHVTDKEAKKRGNSRT